MLAVPMATERNFPPPCDVRMAGLDDVQAQPAGAVPASPDERENWVAVPMGTVAVPGAMVRTPACTTLALEAAAWTICWEPQPAVGSKPEHVRRTESNIFPW
jgi:hypothetical protein